MQVRCGVTKVHQVKATSRHKCWLPEGHAGSHSCDHCQHGWKTKDQIEIRDKANAEIG